MDPVRFAVFGLGFLISLRFSYEVWFAPEKFQKRIAGRRKSVKNFLGFSFWNEGKGNINSVRFTYTLILIGCLLGLIVSITGPITGSR